MIPQTNCFACAESIAAYTGKPLLKIGVADIGLSPGWVEKYLEEYFELANKWNAVLLFDEADIFLEERLSERLGDKERNAVVAGTYCGRCFTESYLHRQSF